MSEASISFFSAKSYDRQFFNSQNKKFGFKIRYFEARLTPDTAPLVEGSDVVCAFVNDVISAETIAVIARYGVRYLVLRCAGFNNVDLSALEANRIKAARVPAYSPQGVAEHTLALLLALNRKIYRAYNRVREGNFSLEGLLGFELGQKTVAVVGTGAIGASFCKLLSGFGCRLLAIDPFPNQELLAQGVEYLSFEDILPQADIFSLHCPLLDDSYHLINHQAVREMKRGAILINTSRGGLVDTPALIDGLKSGKIGGVGLDVYEEEQALFFEDRSASVLQDDIFARLLTFPNVLITGHQAFFTDHALATIAETTLNNAQSFLETGKSSNEIERF